MMTAPDASSYSHIYRLFEFFDKDVEALMLTSNEVTLGNRAAELQAAELGLMLMLEYLREAQIAVLFILSRELM